MWAAHQNKSHVILRRARADPQLLAVVADADTAAAVAADRSERRSRFRRQFQRRGQLDGRRGGTPRPTDRPLVPSHESPRR